MQKIDPIVTSVIKQFHDRSAVGIKKYNTTLEENNSDDFLQHLKEELMDATLYIQKLQSQLIKASKIIIPKEALEEKTTFKEDKNIILDNGINVLSLFDGISTGRALLESLDIKVKSYFSSEIDKNAIEVSEDNYKDITRLGSITELETGNNALLVKGEKIGGYVDIDLLCGGSSCFAKGTKIITDTEYKNIEDIIEGDMVLTHNNRYKKVTNLFKNKSKLFVVKIEGNKPIQTTEEHPFYVREKLKKRDNTKRCYNRYLGEAKWIMAKDLKKGMTLGLPINTRAENKLNITEEEAYIIGRYIADGWTRKDLRKNRTSRHYSLSLSIGKGKDIQFTNKISTHYYKMYKITESCKVARFCNKRLVQIVEEHCGTGAINKKLSMTLINLPVDILKRIIEGYLDGDGSLIDNHKWTMNSISEELISSLSLAIAKVYKVNSGYNFYKRPKTTIIEGRTVNQHDSYSTQFIEERQTQSNFIVDNGFIWCNFQKSEEKAEVTTVYNFEVEEDNSYVADNIVVHNCQNFSMAGQQAGMITVENVKIETLEQYLKYKKEKYEFKGESYLFWEYVRLLREVNPRHFFLENVKMSKYNKDIITEAIIKARYPIEEWKSWTLPEKRVQYINEDTKTKEFNIAEIQKFQNIKTGKVEHFSVNYINSGMFSAQTRRRLYWTNIEISDLPEQSKLVTRDIITEIGQEEDILSDKQKAQMKEFGCSYSFGGKTIGLGEKFTTITASYGKASGNGGKVWLKDVLENLDYRDMPTYMYGDYQGRPIADSLKDETSNKFNTITTGSGHLKMHILNKYRDKLRTLSVLEVERLMGMPEGYTKSQSKSKAIKCLGNGWQFDTVKFLWKNLKDIY